MPSPSAVGPDGALTEHGPRRLLPVAPRCMSPPIMPARFLFIAYNVPSRGDGASSGHRRQHRRRGGTDRQAAISASMPTRCGRRRATSTADPVHAAAMTPPTAKPEDPGHIEVFGFKDGQLANLQTIKPARQRAGLRAAAPGFSSRRAALPMSRWSGKTACAVFGLKPDGTLTAGAAVPEERADRSATARPSIPARAWARSMSIPMAASSTRPIAARARVRCRRPAKSPMAAKTTWRCGPSIRRTGEPTLIQHA